MIWAVRRVICLPTYDERENLEPMVRALGALGLEGLEVLVIDDGSPDGTGEIADRLAAELPWVHVLHRERKEGLGPAYLAGFARALGARRRLRLRDGLRLLARPGRRAPARRGRGGRGSRARLALRAGGGTRNWGLVRRFISRGGSLYAQVLLQLGIRDLTGGFKCYRRAVLETIDLSAIDSRGYAFQIETTYRAIRAGFRVVEVPITFADREVGGSKMSKSIVLEAIWKVPALRLRALAGRL